MEFDTQTTRNFERQSVSAGEQRNPEANNNDDNDRGGRRMYGGYRLGPGPVGGGPPYGAVAPPGSAAIGSPVPAQAPVARFGGGWNPSAGPSQGSFPGVVTGRPASSMGGGLRGPTWGESQSPEAGAGGGNNQASPTNAVQPDSHRRVSPPGPMAPVMTRPNNTWSR